MHLRPLARTQRALAPHPARQHARGALSFTLCHDAVCPLAAMSVRTSLLRDLFWIAVVVLFMAGVVVLSNHNQAARRSVRQHHLSRRARRYCVGILHRRRPSIFTRIIRRQAPAKILYEDSRAIAFLGLNKVAPIQFLVVPKKQLATLEEARLCDEGLLGHLLLVARHVARRQGIRHGYRVVLNNGRNALQEVPHMHFHVFGGRRMRWPPGV